MKCWLILLGIILIYFEFSSDSIARKLELKRNQVMENQRQCSFLERTVNELRSEQVSKIDSAKMRKQLAN